VATPLNNSVKKYTTRRNTQGLIYSFPEAEQVYRRRINRLPPRRLLLDNLGEEALTDIQYLFLNNNQPTVNSPVIARFVGRV
jgi:hypothetical protein